MEGEEEAGVWVVGLPHRVVELGAILGGFSISRVAGVSLLHPAYLGLPQLTLASRYARYFLLLFVAGI